MHIWYICVYWELCFWRRLLRVPWKARWSNQSIFKEINPEYTLEGLMLKLKLQYFGHMMGRADSLEKTLILGKIEGRRRRERQRMRWFQWHHQLNGHELQQTPGDDEGQRSLVCCCPWDRKESDMTWWLNSNSNNKNWTYSPIAIKVTVSGWLSSLPSPKQYFLEPAHLWQSELKYTEVTLKSASLTD